MKIAFIIPSLRQTGPIIVVHSLCQKLIKLGIDIDVYYFDSIHEMKFCCPVHQINFNEAIKFDDYDIIHSHCFRPDKYLYKWKSKIKKAKIVTTLHQDTYASFRYDYNPLFSYILTRYWCYIQSKFDGIISISNQLKNTYKKYFKNNITTIYNGVSINKPKIIDNNILKDIYSLKEKGYCILGTYAYVVKRKGLNQVLDALYQNSKYAFVIIGNGPEIENLKTIAHNKQISDRVLFIPHVNQPYLYLQDIDIYIMPSYSEGFGLAMVEAALVQKPIVCSNLPSFHEIFNQNEASFFELNNIDSLIHAIEITRNNIKSYSELAYNRAYNYFTDFIMAENHLNYYLKLIK